ncbi:hypothetical protein [Bradyrhizobium sp. HKCCYLS20291]|uniref:hypothetical protein n=1 Tax=Bradyrhizobium sp. HKCCYLS20291 TaxID=3420766 RepID=UPI003EBCD729
MTADPVHVRPADDLIEAYKLELLKEPADWSIENGDLATTADGDIKVGSTAYNAMHRLVELWGFTELNMQSMFNTVQQMLQWQSGIWDDLNAAGDQRYATMSGDPFGPEFAAFARAIRESHEKEAIAILARTTRPVAC